MLLRHRPDLVTRTVDGELIILDRTAETVHHLNATATYIWSACDGTHSANDIAASLTASFGDVPPTVLDDVLTTLADFRRRGFLVDVDVPPPPAAGPQ
jgi:hypothetical protein